MNTERTPGGCLCGKIRYIVKSPPTRSMICHCETCRRSAASPAVAWVTFALKDLIYKKGKPKAYKSSAAVVRTFCSSCGTALTYYHSNRPNEIDITTCSLDNPELFWPTHHSWMEDGLNWARFDDGLPKFQKARSDNSD